MFIDQSNKVSQIMYYTCLLKQILYTEIVAERSKKRKYIFIVSTD